ncbi:isochorismatase family protein [Chelatococcus sp. SYSU_G07232]|uniref:Isochorismatase family protein n=1 Tax=Chelatococcus albus TaxID=3047466 RepID=A0ABT7AG76_9HYPH|nr:isochorismatase family protein [Chelatococcus sp. SYSU_G07232]MDJ1158333.1 isochorismatase family protein [Chelatococcus sp. SYSU_G07232]
MRMLDAARSTLLLVDFQARLMPAISGAAAAIANAQRLAAAAHLLGVPILATEQNPAGLGGTVDELAGRADTTVAKTSFDASAGTGLTGLLSPDRASIVVAGWEAHVCVLQTALGLAAKGFAPVIVQDAVASRRPESKAGALQRLAHHRIEIVTTEMVVFEWLRDCTHPAFREALALVKDGPREAIGFLRRG